MKNTIFFLLVIIISSSCTERIDNLKLDSSVRRLVVEGIITNESKAHQVKLSYTSDYFSDEPSPPATGATVLLMYNNQILELEETIPGCYFTPDSFRGRPGVKYELNILGIDADEDGVNDEFTAENYLYPVTNIDSFHVMAREVWSSNFWEIGLYALEPGETEDFYLIKIYKNGILLTDTLPEYSITDDLLFNGNYMWGVPVYYLDMEREDENLNNGDMITFELSRISEDYYKFLVEAMDVYSGSNPLFSGPAANVYSNISGNALGYFETLSVKRQYRYFSYSTK